MSTPPNRRRSRGPGLAVALVLVGAYTLAQWPLAFLSVAGCGAPSSRHAVAPRHGLRAPGRSPRVQRAARGGEVTYEVGDKVKAQSPDDENWYPGKITKANDDGTWEVTWDDADGGPETNSLGPDSLKKIIIFKDYVVGDDCRAISPDDDRWYPGVVTKVLGGDKFQVKWDDPDGGDETSDVEAEFMKKVIIFKDYKVDDEVLAKFPEDGQMYEAVVLKKNTDGTFQVKWDDPGDDEEDSPVSPKDMKYPPIPFDKLEVGQKYKGIVRTIMDFGAFVDIGAEGDGLLHISRIANERVDDIYQYVEEAQEVEVWISGKRDDGKFGLTMVEGKTDGGGRRAPADMTKFADISPDEWHEGEVRNIMGFGAFVSVTIDGETADGLVHISQIRDGFVDNVEDEVEIGQKVRVRIQSVDLDTNKMSLSMKEGFGGGGGGGMRAPADLSAFENIDPGTFITGKVARIASFGAFVTVKAPDSDAEADGLVHITQIRDGFVESVEDEMEEGQEVKVRVTNVDVAAGKMGLSMKADDGFS